MNKGVKLLHVYFYEYELIDERYLKYIFDVFFTCVNFQYSFIVIETFYSHKYKNLTKLIDEHICDFDKNIDVILELDIEYDVKLKKTSIFI